MAFKDNFRIEKIYFQRVKDDAQILGSWKNDPRRYSREEIVRVAKDACDSILMLYRLIGECWNDALNQIEKLGAELEALAGKAEAYHDELNEKIDEVNNYLNTQIKNLEIRMDAVEADLESLIRNVILDLVYDETEQTYYLKNGNQTLSFADVTALYNAPSIVFVRGMFDNELTYLVPREYDTTTATGTYAWASMGFVNDTIHERTVTMLPDDTVNVSTDVFEGGSTKRYFLGVSFNETTNEYSIINDDEPFYVGTTETVHDPDYEDYDAWQFTHTTKDVYAVFDEYYKGKATIGCLVRSSGPSVDDTIANMISVKGNGQLTNWGLKKLVFNLVSVNHTATIPVSSTYGAGLFLTYDVTTTNITWEPLFKNGYAVVPDPNA